MLPLEALLTHTQARFLAMYGRTAFIWVAVAEHGDLFP